MRKLPLPDRAYQKELVIKEDYRKEREDVTMYDILYFVECLGEDRDVHYVDRGQPDVDYRNAPRPDRLVEDEKTGCLLVIEYADLRKSQEDTQRLAYKLEKVGWSFGNDNPSPQELAARLTGMINEKKNKNQFVNYPNAERILLFRNRWVFGRKTIEVFYDCSQYLVLPDDPGCDHCYILLSTGVVLEVF